jgi:hypothetical protein
VLDEDRLASDIENKTPPSFTDLTTCGMNVGGLQIVTIA